MSRQNVEIVRRSTDAYNRRDVRAIIGAITLDIEWSTVMGTVEGEVFRRSGSFGGEMLIVVAGS